MPSLLCQDRSVRKQVGNCISAIAGLEIPRGEWLELIGTLSECTQNSDLIVRESSLLTLGFICEEIESKFMPPH
jgi:importin subunit beta-1